MIFVSYGRAKPGGLSRAGVSGGRLVEPGKIVGATASARYRRARRFGAFSSFSLRIRLLAAQEQISQASRS